MIKLISGTKETVNEDEEHNGDNIDLTKDESQHSPKISSKLIQKMQLEILRSDLENKGQLTSFASSMTIHNNLTHLGPHLTSTS